METNPDLLLAKRAELQLLQQKKQLIKADGLAFYRPHAKQDAFHRAAWAKYRLWESGNRSGKSTGGVAEDCSYLRGFRPFYPTDDPARTLGIPQGRPLKGLVITTDWDKVDEIFTSQRGEEGKLWRFLPPGFVKNTRRNHSGAIDTVECVNGSILRFDTVKSWMSNPQGSESSDYDFIHVDEPCPQKMFIAATRGLIDRGGPIWFTLTPVEQPWIHLMFFPARQSKDELIVKGKKWAQRGSTHDNTFLSKENIADYEATLTRDERACRIDGIPLALSGLVYKEFDYDKHVLSTPLPGWQSFSKPPANAVVYVAIDPHPQTPHHVLFMALLPYNVPVLFDEIFLHCPIPDLGKAILDRTNGMFVGRTICDPYAFLEHPNTHVNSYATDLAQAGVFVAKASKDRSAGILKVKQQLTTPNGLFVSPLLEETLSEFATHCWVSKANKPKDENDHAMENLGRLFLENPTWYDSTMPQQPLPELAITQPEYDLPSINMSEDF